MEGTTRRTGLTTILAAVAAGAMALGGNARAQKTVRLGHVDRRESHSGVGVDAFAEEVERVTGSALNAIAIVMFVVMPGGRTRIPGDERRAHLDRAEGIHPHHRADHVPDRERRGEARPSAPA